MTTINIEAAVVRQALEALEAVSDYQADMGHHRDAIASLRTALANPAEQQEPMAFDDWPEYHEQAMGCGLEDRCITDRYEAMRYGWDEALERAWEAVNLLGPLYTTPTADAKLEQRIAELEKDAARMDWLEGSDEGHGFCHSGFSEYRYYARQIPGYKTVREIIDAAMKEKP